MVGKAGAGLSLQGLRQIKSELTNQIFRQEMLHIYEQKSVSRDELVRQTRKSLRELTRQMRSSICDQPDTERLMQELSSQLESVHGKKSYGYLPKQAKKIVDEIVDQMGRLPVVSECYDQWWQLQCQVDDHYSEKERKRPKLSEQKEFRAIKNAVIREAEHIRMGTVSFEDKELEREDEWFDDRRLSYDCWDCWDAINSEDTPLDDRDYTANSLNELAEDGDAYAQFFLERLDDFKPPSVILSVTRLLHHMGNIFQDHSLPKSGSTGMQIDRKRLAQLREKKIALGHKPDDYEDQGWGGMTMGGW